jgi:prepilin-type N-terminal cleavage/methylation domain-containing protein
MRNAFSLVELSIVLVILGLLTGGVLAGQSLIRAAELRSVNNEATKYISAVHTFRDKYFALPGDMANATRFWGAAHATPATCRNTVSTSAATCDGNGDGRVLQTGTSMEQMRFWQHLANAGLLEGSYDGVSNFPVSRFPDSYWGTY